MTTVHALPKYHINPPGEPPTGYPSEAQPDVYQLAPVKSTFAQRRAGYVAHILKNPAPKNTKPVWHELLRMAGGEQAHEGVFHAALDFIEARNDCADFVHHSILRLLYQFDPAKNQLDLKHPPSEALLTRAKETTLGFKYFPDEPGIDSMCTWTENHYILFTSAGYLAGQLFPDEVFSNSTETGRQKIELNRTRILRWLDLRFHTGFSEWLSHVYYDEDLTALLALRDFAEDEEIRRKAEMVIDLLLFDMALNSFKGVFGSTHGRSYENTKKWASNEGTTDTFKLLFGTGIFSGFDNMSAVAFALSGYRVPDVLEQIANQTTFENRQRMGIKIAEMEKWGLHPDNFEDGMLYLTLEAYLHPKTIANTIRMFDTCNWWENAFLDDFKPYRGLLKLIGAVGALPLLIRSFERDVCRNTREEVNIYTYKTPDYMLSTAQDHRKGYGGDQQHIWQATLGPDAVCFTTHPAKIEGVTPNYWAGNGLLPRAAQYKNVAIIIYNIEKIPALYVPIKHFFTHAWLPKDKFDEVQEKDGWIFARKGEGYLALRSQNPYVWNTDDSDGTEIAHSLRTYPEDLNREVIVQGKQNIWVCQMGSKTENGEFVNFVENVTSAEISFSGMNVKYVSPGNGAIRFGWDQPLSIDKVEFKLNDYPRYENAFSQTEFNSNEVKIGYGAHKLILNWITGERRTE